MNEEALKQYSQLIRTDNLPDTPDKYIAAFRTLATLADQALNYLENNQGLSDEDHQRSVAAAAHMVETLALMRGERGVLLENVKPSLAETDYQSEMYKIEDYLRHRLVQLGYTYND